MPAKTTMRYHYTPVRMAKIKNTIPAAGKTVEELELAYIAPGNEQWQQPL